ncbi:hypothetical protein [Modestobacter sp. Leaf380]|uniref:hypothetical protein n=1 Tax=Modestobacter sp. Leaf380 TaxID=1736356 RepID=UPI0006FE8E92|nr:hypothetical protein [Modestobacter sp. Leaf380]KQS68670.1 hypothetical protein ASG41_07010 [Modestobacter sp. Leaf380]
MTSCRAHAPSRTAPTATCPRRTPVPAPALTVVVDRDRTPARVTVSGRVGPGGGPALTRLLGTALGTPGAELHVDLSRLRLGDDDARAALRAVVLSRPAGPRVTLLADGETVDPVRDLLGLQLAWCPVEVRRRWRLQRPGAHAGLPAVARRRLPHPPAA